MIHYVLHKQISQTNERSLFFRCQTLLLADPKQYRDFGGSENGLTKLGKMASVQVTNLIGTFFKYII